MPWSKVLLILAVIFPVSACQSESIDDQKPVIDLTLTDAFPTHCSTLYIGEPFVFKALFTDNAELGSYSLSIHHDFDHHAHSTEVEECTLSPVKTPVNPFVLIREYDIPEGLTEYTVQQEITIPDNGYDEGDYHFFISLTDKEGWRAEKGISLKLARR